MCVCVCRDDTFLTNQIKGDQFSILFDVFDDNVLVSWEGGRGVRCEGER